MLWNLTKTLYLFIQKRNIYLNIHKKVKLYKYVICV